MPVASKRNSHRVLSDEEENLGCDGPYSPQKAPALPRQLHRRLLGEESQAGTLLCLHARVQDKQLHRELSSPHRIPDHFQRKFLPIHFRARSNCLLQNRPDDPPDRYRTKSQERLDPGLRQA